MAVLCDTCAVLMLLRIAPEMFTEPRYGCVTIHNVREEIFRTTRLKHRYPWRELYRDRIMPVYQRDLETDEFKKTLEVVRLTMETSLNIRTHRSFGLSRVDCRIAAAVIIRDETLCTAEHDLEDFMLQQFDCENIPPLRLVNDWIEDELIDWNDNQQSVIEDWIACNERPQPNAEISRFENLVGRNYPQ